VISVALLALLSDLAHACAVRFDPREDEGVG